jgi:hypothetical protein
MFYNIVAIIVGAIDDRGFKETKEICRCTRDTEIPTSTKSATVQREKIL